MKEIKRDIRQPHLSFSHEVVMRAIRLFLSHLVFVSSAKLLYDFLPYYQSLLRPETKQALAAAYLLYVLLAPFYYLLAFSSGRMKEPDIQTSKSTLMLRYLKKTPAVFRQYCTFRAPSTFPAQLNMDRPTRTAFQAFLVKLFFIPVMTNFLFDHIVALTALCRHIPQNVSLYQWTFDWLYWVIYNAIFTVDVGIFVFSYASEARWLGNQIKSVEPTFFGWAVALCCYPPFNSLAGIYLPTAHSNKLVIASLPILAIFKCVILLLFFIYVWATLSLMTKCGNLVNRGIVTRGAYGVVRHPAYISKCLAWWFENLPYILFDLRSIFFLLCWNIIYFFRALTEEKHLIAADPDYGAYAKKVKYRFIPGIY